MRKTRVILNKWNKKNIVISLFILLLFISNAVISFSQKPAEIERIKGWNSDIEALLSKMKSDHIVYKTKPFPAGLIDSVADLKANINKYSDERMLLELQQLAWYMQDGHSYVLPLSQKIPAHIIPLDSYVFSDGLFVINATETNKELIGTKIISINGIKSEKLLKDMNGYVHQDNKYTVQWFAPSYIKFRSVYERYGLSSDSKSINIKFMKADKTVFTKAVNFVPIANFHSIPKLSSSKLASPETVPLYMSKMDDFYWFTKLNEGKVVYLQFNQVSHKKTESLFDFGKRLDTFLRTENPKLLIIDVRYNNGGSLEYLTDLVEAVKNFERRNSQSKIVVITGRNTFSAAQIFINLLDKETDAIFAGEPSASSPNFVGEGNYFTLPWSGAAGSISNVYHETIPGDKRKWIEPEIKVRLSSGEYFRNEDPVMKKILAKFVVQP